MPQRPFVSARFSPAGRTHSFLLPDLLGADPGGVVAGVSPARDGAGAGVSPAGDAGSADRLRQGAGGPPTRSAEAEGPRYEPGVHLVVESGDGEAVATTVRVPSAIAERRSPPDSTPMLVVRRATEADIVQKLKQQEREKEAHRVALLKIRERALAMKLTKVECLFDGSRIIFYYTAEARVDFRELVRDLAAHFHVRIEMRQIGVRDEAKMLGGYGSCGRPLCCTTWLNAFAPVSIKMAKRQHLSLNPSKLSGQCGRLKCCLRYELPNGEGVKHAGCADHGSCSNPTGCAAGNCESCG